MLPYNYVDKGGSLMDRTEQLDFLINYLLDECNEDIKIPDDFTQKRNLLRSLMNVRPAKDIGDDF